MTRRSGARHPRWTRAFIAAAFIASIAVGASLGLEQRVQPVALAAGRDKYSISQAVPTRHVEPHGIQFFVVPQSAPHSPYGTLVTFPEIGVPANLSTFSPELHRPMLSCDLIASTISETVFVTDELGSPVSGARLLFTVLRSDVSEPQLVSAITNFSGEAVVTVKVPTSPAPNGSVATYSVLAEAFGSEQATPAASVVFPINDYTCTGGAGGR